MTTATRSEEQIRDNKEKVERITNYLFGEIPKQINFKPAGQTNYVYEVNLSQGDFIIRIAGSLEKINDFIKEQWAIARAREKGIPVAEILEVGNSIIQTPYMVQKKVAGQNALNHAEQSKIVEQMGRYTKLIHSIQTTNFGTVFDWSNNQLSINGTWQDYLSKEIDVSCRLNVLSQHNMLTKRNYTKLVSHISKIDKLNISPVLNHGDIRLKNVLIDDEANIIAIIDWEDCCSNIAPYWDLSIALHDLSIDDKQKFLEGYGLSSHEYSDIVYALKTFNILNYTSIIEKLAEEKNDKELEHYRLRLNGYYDLYSL